MPEEYTSYLLPNEKIELSANLGFIKYVQLYVILATNMRIIIIKKFPRNLIELEYKDTEVVEYYTNVEWLQLLYAGFLFILSWIFFVNRDAILKKMTLFLPPAEPIIYAGNFFGMTAGSFLVFAALIIAAIYFFGLFVISLFGRLRVLIYEQAPVEIVAAFTPELQQLIKLINIKKRMMNGKPAALPQPPKGIA